MKELLLQLAAYNLWANQLLLPAVCALTEEEQKRVVPSSFGSLHGTVLHMWDAESIWWQRLKLLERITAPSKGFAGTTQEAANNLLQQNKQWNDWVIKAQEHVLLHVFQYQNSRQEQFKQPTFQMLLHVFHHGTYHRGQLVNMLRQLGVQKIPQTDFIVWSRKKMG